MFRIGIGYDIHLLVDERKLFIGGIEIPYVKGLLGHSDGDVLLHAIGDALLGAAGEGDIGQHFPDTDHRYQGISSRELLKTVVGLIKDKGFRINNIDTIIIAQEPKFMPFKKQLQQSLSQLLELKENCLNIKAKTNEGLGEIGKNEAIACWAVAIISK